MDTPSLGAIKSPPDYRDVPASAAGAVALPTSFKTDISQLPVWDQKKIGSCVAHAFAKCMQIWWFLKHGEIVHFSPRFLFALAKSQDGIAGDNGTYPRLVASIAKNTGCCTEELLPNDSTLSFADYIDITKLTPEMYVQAAKYKIPGYAFATTAEEVRQLIFKYGSVAQLMRIGSEWWLPSWLQKDIYPLRTPQTVVSGHEITVYGWDGLYNLILNSWSKLWALLGTNKYGINSWAPYVEEAIAIVDLSPDILNTVKGLPTKDSFKHKFTIAIDAGARGPEVVALQTALMIDGEFDTTLYGNLLSTNELGYFRPAGSTQTALLLFQKKYNIPQYPRVGPMTMSKLNVLYGG